jgi:hypothetical protein
VTSSSQTTTTVAFCSLAVHWIALCLYQIKIDWPGKLGRTLQPQSIHEGPGLTLDQPSRERTWSIPEDRDHFLDTGPQSSSLHHRLHFCQEEWKHLLQRTSTRPPQHPVPHQLVARRARGYRGPVAAGLLSVTTTLRQDVVVPRGRGLFPGTEADHHRHVATTVTTSARAKRLLNRRWTHHESSQETTASR